MASSVGDALLNITVDRAQVAAALRSAIGSNDGTIAAEGQKLSKSLTGGLTGFQKFGAGVAATGLIVAGVSTKMALDFESSLTSIRALTNSSEQDIDQYRSAILKLGPEVAQSPKQLAEALYFVSSAGFAGKEAIDVLTISAKAAAAGLTDTKVVADAVTSALNAYGHANLTAKQASDVLVATVNEGKAEFGDIAGAIGQVVGVASAAGVSFNEVGAAMAAMTSIGLSADESATVLKSTLVALEAPSEKVKNMLGELGLNADSLRASIREKGLIATVQDLGNRLHGQVGPLLELIPNHRTLALVLGATGAQAQQYNDILGRLNHASDGAGATARAFAERQKDVKFQIQQAVAAAQAMAVNFGEHLIPVLRGTLEVGRAVTGFFAENKIAAYALAVVVGGPLVAAAVAWTVAETRLVAGKLISFWSSVADLAVGLVGRFLGLNTALSTIGQTEGIVGLRTQAMGASFGSVAAGAGIVGGAIALLTLSMTNASGKAQQLRQDLAKIADDEILQKFRDLDKVANQGGLAGIARGLIGQAQSQSETLRTEFKKIADESPGTAQRIVDAMKRSGQATGDYEQILAGVSKGQAQAGKDAEKSAQITGDAAKKMGGDVKAAGDQGKAAISELTDQQAKHQQAIDGVVTSLKGLGPLAGIMASQFASGTKASDDELKKLATSIDKVHDAYRGLPTDAGQALAILGAQGKLTADQLSAIATEAQKLRDSIASSFTAATSIVGNFADKLGGDPTRNQLDAKAATLGHTAALNSQAEAQAKLNDLRSGKTKVEDPADRARQIAAAENAVAQAGIEVERTSLAAKDAQDKLGLSIGSINKFFSDQVAAARAWSTNLQSLVAAGVDHGLIAELAQAGPKAAPLVQGLLDDVRAGNLGIINKSQEDLRSILTQTQGTILGYETPFFVAGQTDGFGFSQGLGAGVSGAAAAMRDALIQASRVARMEEYMEGLGRSIGSFFVAGLQSEIAKAAVLGQSPDYIAQHLSSGSRELSYGTRAGGGPVWPGDWLVGEKGPEILHLERSGYVVPNDMLNGRSGGSTGPTVVSKDSHYHFEGSRIEANDPQQLISEMEHRARLRALSGEA